MGVPHTKAAFSCYHIQQRETVSLNSAYRWTVLDRSTRIIYFIKFSERKWWKWVRWFPLRVRMKELGKNAASIRIHYLFSQMLSSSWMENYSSLLSRSRPNRWSKFPWCSTYLVLAFISFDKDLLVWRLQGGLFYIPILVQLLPATLVHCQRQLQKVTELVCIAFHLPGSKCNCFVFHGLKMTRYQPLTPCRANQDAAKSARNCYVGTESRSVITECVWTQ